MDSNSQEVNKGNNRLTLSAKGTSLASFVISAMLLLITLLSLYVERQGSYNKVFYKYFALELAAVMVITMFLAISRNEFRHHSIDCFAILFWAGFTAYTLVSDILVDKGVRFAESGIFIVLFLLGYCWHRMDDKGRFIIDLERAVQWFLVGLLLLSIVFPMQSRVEGRYSGPIENPSVYALYLCAIWAVLLGSFEENVKNKKSKAKLIITVTEMAVTMVLMILSQSLTPMIALAAVTFLWFFRQTARRKGFKHTVLLFILIGVLMMLGLIGFVVMIRSTGFGGDSRIVQKLQSADITAFLSGRDYYWRRYLSEMNLFGHSKKPFLWDHRILPHNALIGMMYWYGVPCVIPYIIIMVMAIEKSYRFANTAVPYAAVPFYSIVSFVIMSMADNVEQPFVWLPWISCYLMMAPILVMPVEEIEALKEGKAEAHKEVMQGKHDILKSANAERL